MNACSSRAKEEPTSSRARRGTWWRVGRSARRMSSRDGESSGQGCENGVAAEEGGKSGRRRARDSRVPSGLRLQLRHVLNLQGQRRAQGTQTQRPRDYRVSGGMTSPDGKWVRSRCWRRSTSEVKLAEQRKGQGSVVGHGRGARRAQSGNGGGFVRKPDGNSRGGQEAARAEGHG